MLFLIIGLALCWIYWDRIFGSSGGYERPDAAFVGFVIVGIILVIVKYFSDK